MEFGLSQDQKLMQESVRRTLERVAPLERIRRAVGVRETVAADIWEALVGLGLPGLIVPEEFGGSALGLLDAALMAEMLGRHVAPAPFLATIVMAPVALIEAGSDSQKETWLPKLASGEIRAGVAVSERASGAREGARITASGGRLNGSAMFAFEAQGADLIIVADEKGALHLVAGKAAGLTLTPLETIDLTRDLSELHFDNVEAEPLAGDSGHALSRMIAAGRIILAADTLGAGDMMIEKAVDYAKERKQFGRVIGSFQAVKHLCAEMAAELEPGRALIWYAAHAFDTLPDDASLMATHAKAHLSEVGRFVARTSTEVHGGMGFTDLLGLHYWFKRIGLDRQLLGGPERLRHEAAVVQGLAAA